MNNYLKKGHSFADSLAAVTKVLLSLMFVTRMINNNSSCSNSSKSLSY